MNPFGTRGAADELARLLDAGATTGTPGIALAAQLRSTGAVLESAVAPRAEFRNALRMRLLAVATVSGAAPPLTAASPVAAPARALEAATAWRRRAGAIAAGAMASVVAVSGVAVAGSQSLPGDPFYGVKRTTEAFQLRAADGPVEKGTLHLDLAATRLREVRGLALGRDSVDAGPALGPSAMTGGIRLSSASQQLATGAALSPAVAERVEQTLDEMDEQTREGSALLTQAFRSSQAAEPLQALSRFATRQSAGLSELLPALPPATQPSARASLALLTDVSTSTDELLGLGTCAEACDPSRAAPTLDPDGNPAAPASSPEDCVCPEPSPAPEPTTQVAPAPDPTTQPAPQPEPTRSAPAPGSPDPEPTDAPLPVPTLPVPVPTLPVPVPSTSIPPLDDVMDPLLDPVLDPLDTTLDGLTGSSRGTSDDQPVPTPTPVPQLAPAPARK